jgi:hypothetical protein
MAFPIVESFAETTHASNARVLQVDIPSGVSDGDLLLCFAACDNSANLLLSALDGFTLIDYGAAGGTNDSHWVFTRVATSSEPPTRLLAVGAGANEVISAICFRIRGGRDVEVAKLETTENYSVAIPNPVLTPSWGSDDYLWFASLGRVIPDTPPAGYSTIVSSGVAASAGAYIAATYRSATGSTETPGNWLSATGGTQGHIAFTVAVRPFAGGGGSSRPSSPFLQQVIG